MFHVDMPVYPRDFEVFLTMPPTMPLSPSSNGTPAQGDRPFCCPVPSCNGRFHRKFTLHEHMKTHTGEKPHECPIASCGKRFSTSGNLARHKRLHTLSKLKCPVTECTRIFTKKEKLLRHLKVHMGSAPHTCQVPNCSKTFSTAGNLTRHMKSQHPTHSIVRALPSPSSSVPAATSLPDRFIHNDQHHLHVSVDTSAHEAIQAAQSENLSDHEIMELLDCLFVEPAIASLECNTHASMPSSAFMPAHHHHTGPQVLVYL